MEDSSTDKSNKNEEIPFDVLFREKCGNFIQFIMDNTIFIGEWEKKAQQFGEGLKDHLVLEVLIGYQMLLIILEKKCGWTFEKLKAIQSVEEENQVIEDCIKLFEEVGKGEKISAAIKFKDNVNKEDFKHKCFRYLVFFANVHNIASNLMSKIKK